MRATLREGSAGAGFDRPIVGTFFPDAGAGAPTRAAGAVVPKILAVVVGMALVRMLIAKGHRHGGGSMRDRRKAMIAQLHRELHAADEVTA